MAPRIKPEEMSLLQLKRRIDSSVLSTARVRFHTARLADIYNKRLNSGEKKSGHISIMEIGGQATISGSGQIYEHFKKTGVIQGFTGFGQKAKTFYEENFFEAPLREINFDETYYGMHYNCRDSVVYDPAKDILLRIEDEEQDIPSYPATQQVQAEIDVKNGILQKRTSGKNKRDKEKVIEKKYVDVTTKGVCRKCGKGTTAKWIVVAPKVCVMEKTTPKNKRRKIATDMTKSKKKCNIVKCSSPASPKDGARQLPVRAMYAAPVLRSTQASFVQNALPESHNVSMQPSSNSLTQNHPQYSAQQSQDFYGDAVESYRTSTPVAQILNSTFDKLHYSLSLNDHDKFIFP